MNPFSETPISLEDSLQSFRELYPKSYAKSVDPYTKTRIILANGAEYEANWFSHQAARHCVDNDLKRELARIRFIEKQQQQKIAMLKPKDETVLQHTISYEQLAVDLTAELAQRVDHPGVKQALDFALLEDFDHLYRYANLLEMEEGIHAEKLVGKYTEIMPGRPTVAHHRCAIDNVKKGIDDRASVQTSLFTMIITAAEQQTMNYYMNVSAFQATDVARKLYQEIALVEEEHVTQYESLMNASSSWLEMMLWHEYCECYIYYSNYMTESDKRIRAFWEENLAMEIAHLHAAADVLKKYEKKEWQQVLGTGEFPDPVSLHSNIDYVREVLGNTVCNTADLETYRPVSDMPEHSRFFEHQAKVNNPVTVTPSHTVITDSIRQGGDYRFETAENPVPELRNRKKDNMEVGRVQ